MPVTAKAPLVSAILARNEAGRYLPEVLDRCAQWSDIVVLDDGSTDDSYDLCRAHPAVRHVQRRQTLGGMWGREALARAELWDLARQHGEWVLVCDADQLMVGNPADLVRTEALNSWSFVLFDLWTEGRTEYREDGYWQGHKHHRPWLFCPDRVPEGFVPEWPSRGIHTGHFPTNFPLHCGQAPADAYYWLHLSYSKQVDRDAKHRQYLTVGGQLTEFEKAHAESIVLKPSLRTLPSERVTRVLIGASVRKPVPVLTAHLQTLEWQELPDKLEVAYAFVSDYPAPDPAEELLGKFVESHPNSVLFNPKTRAPANDFSEGPLTHEWTQTAMGRVANNKHAIFQHALQHNFDFVWLVDSDLLLDKTVLKSLLAAQKAVTSAVYWTRWHKTPSMKAAPQVWLAPVYQLAKGPYYPEHKFRSNLTSRSLIQVGGLGACTLIHRSVLEKGVNCNKPPQFPSGGLWDGEDRHFCEWARRMHVEMWADAWPDIYHVYHAEDAERIPAMLARLEEVHPLFPQAGDLISLKLENIEQGVAEYARGRIGTLRLLPEIEDAIMGMRRGERRTVKVHYPADFPFDPLRGQSSLIDLSLSDIKRYSLPPVLEDEFHLSPNGVFADATLYSERQRDSLAAAD